MDGGGVGEHELVELVGVVLDLAIAVALLEAHGQRARAVVGSARAMTPTSPLKTSLS